VKATQDDGWYKILRQFRKTLRAITKYSGEIQQTFGVTLSQLGVLARISAHGPISLGELATKTGAHITTVERFANQLHDKKLIHKNRGKEDRRRLEVSITEEGRKLLEKVPDAELPFSQNVKLASDRQLSGVYRALLKLEHLCTGTDGETG
jgi:DNA-binding MarR family transcriptional regulator